MIRVGDKLKEARLKQGKSIRDIAQQTRISAQFLEAIEADDLEAIPGEFFRRSFVKQYASALGLNPEEVQPETPMEFRSLGGGPTPSLPEVRMHELPDLPPIPAMGQQRTLPWRQMLLSVGLLIGVLAVCAVAYTFWEEYQVSRGRQEAAETVVPIPPQYTSVPADEPAVVDPPAVAEPGVPASGDPSVRESARAAEPAAGVLPPSASQSPAPAPSASDTLATGEPGSNPAGANEPRVHGAGPRELRLSATAPVWVQAREGERTVFVGVINPGQTRILRLTEGARLVVGNAGGLSLVWQGEDTGVVGPMGQVRIVTVTPDGVSVAAPVKSPTAPESSPASGS